MHNKPIAIIITPDRVEVSGNVSDDMIYGLLQQANEAQRAQRDRESREWWAAFIRRYGAALPAVVVSLFIFTALMVAAIAPTTTTEHHESYHIVR